MHKKELYVFFALLLATVILGTQSAHATVNFPNTSSFATHTFSLDLENNGELITVIRYQNLDDDFDWRSYTPLEIPMQITSFSNEKPTVTEVSLGDNYDSINYSVRNYTVSSRQSDYTYIHEYVIELSPKSNVYFHFLKYQLFTISIATKINQISSKVEGDYGKFYYYMPKNFQPGTQSFIIRVNLPNDPYYWEEILDTLPNSDYRTSFGRGESVEWRYKADSPYLSPILIRYKIHPDQIKKDLDDLAVRSYLVTVFALVLGIIAIRKDIKDVWQRLKQKLTKLEVSPIKNIFESLDKNWNSQSYSIRAITVLLIIGIDIFGILSLVLIYIFNIEKSQAYEYSVLGSTTIIAGLITQIDKIVPKEKIKFA